MRQTTKFSLSLIISVLIVSALSSGVSATNSPCAIHGITFPNATTAVVEVMTEYDSVLFATLYRENGQMAGIGTTLVSGSNTKQSISLAMSSAKQGNDSCKAFLLTRDSYAPLCKALAFTNSNSDAGDFLVSGGNQGRDYVFSNGVLTVLSTNPLTIRNKNQDISTNHTIAIASGINASVTLAGVNIDTSNMENVAALQIADDSTGQVTLTLAKDSVNTLKSGSHCAGLQKNGDNVGTLTITGKGALDVTGGEGGAGIGGGENHGGNGIVIADGVIKSVGGDNGVGIGGGYVSDADKATAKNADIQITGGEISGSIGGGTNGNGVNIKIDDGAITSGRIGGGSNGNDVKIAITGGSITANHIGAGYRGKNTEIEISGGDIHASGGSGAVIGGSAYQSGNTDIIISGGHIEVDGSDYFATGIGADGHSWDTHITISGGEVTAYGGHLAAGIGCATECSDTSITITGGVVNAYCRSYGVSIGGNSGSIDVSISGGVVNAGCLKRTHAVKKNGLIEFGDYYIGDATVGIGDTSSIEGPNRRSAAKVTISGGMIRARGNRGSIVGTNGVLIQGDCVVNAEQGIWPKDSSTENWRGVVFDGSESRMYGDSVTIQTASVFPSGRTLTIGNSQTLTINPNTTLRLDGAIVNNGQMKNNGSIINALAGRVFDGWMEIPASNMLVTLHYGTASGTSASLNAITDVNGEFVFAIPEDAISFSDLIIIAPQSGVTLAEMDLSGSSPADKPFIGTITIDE